MNWFGFVVCGLKPWFSLRANGKPSLTSPIHPNEGETNFRMLVTEPSVSIFSAPLSSTELAKLGAEAFDFEPARRAQCNEVGQKESTSLS